MMKQYLRTNKQKEKTLPAMNESMNTQEEVNINIKALPAMNESMNTYEQINIKMKFLPAMNESMNT